MLDSASGGLQFLRPRPRLLAGPAAAVDLWDLQPSHLLVPCLNGAEVSLALHVGVWR
jgi:hypothetical protein